MTMTNCKDLVWPALNSAFEESVSITDEDGECRITVPFERADRDAITLWIRREGEEYVISDEGETYGYLYLSNINLDQSRREKRLSSTKQRFDLDSAKYEIKLTTSKERLGQRLLDAIQAVQSISYLSYTRRQYTQTDFRDEVGSYLNGKGYHYERNVDVEGDSEPHRVDFHVQNGKPTYLDALHAEDVSTSHGMAERTAFKWVDIQAGAPEVKTIAVLDDESGEYDERTVRILSNYSDKYIPWSARGSIPDAIG
ncbi:DUF1828 domain-containing protein [Halovenus halobia]|uniref:DUF1828 domain-containing protein n=1 Tax=Halovenus halobia TaxID=3396622 RepID=UPI003F57B6C0